MAGALQKAGDEARRHTLTEARTRDLLSEILQNINGEELRVFTVAQMVRSLRKTKTEVALK
jgi:hypothetical protein